MATLVKKLTSDEIVFDLRTVKLNPLGSHSGSTKERSTCKIDELTAHKAQFTN